MSIMSDLDLIKCRIFAGAVKENCLANIGNVPTQGGCNPTPPRALSYHERMQALKKEKDMYNEIRLNPSISIQPSETFNAVQTAQDHLTERLSEATEAKVRETGKALGMYDDDKPRTPQSLVDRILAGRFVIPEDRKNRTAYEPADYIIWRDPKITKDEAAFEAAQAAINAASDDILDTIIVKGNDAGLDAIKAFKEQKFTN